MKNHPIEKLWIVTPIYFDVESFLELRNQILYEYSNVQFIVLDDSAGIDPQINFLNNLLDTTVITPPFNLGHQRGIVYALRKMIPWISDNDKVITMDGDGEDRPVDLPQLIEKLNEEKNSIVIAQRTKRQESLLFKVFYFFYKIVFKSLTGTVIRSGNFAGFRGIFLKNYIRHPYFNLCYSSTLISLKVQKEFVPCPRGKRIKGYSKMNFTSLIMHGIRMLMPFIDQIAIRSLIGFSILFASSIFISCTIVGIKYFTNAIIPNWAFYTLMMSVFMSFVAVGNFLVLFSVFSQSQSIAMGDLEDSENTPSENKNKLLKTS